MIRQEHQGLPFNITGHEVVKYDPSAVDGRTALRRRIQRMLDAYRRESAYDDSPVLRRLGLRIEEVSSPIGKQRRYRYKIRGHSTDEIRLITGELLDVKGVDVWVNSENTHMLMARHIERSISSAIRFGGAERLASGKIDKDTIPRQIEALMGGREQVDEAEILVTGPGALAASNNVKRIFHAAAATGAPGMGFRPIADLQRCVRNALEQAEKLEDEHVESILFPLMGTGQARGRMEENAAELLDAAISYLLENPRSRIDRIYFIINTIRELEVCRRFLDGNERVDFVDRE